MQLNDMWNILTVTTQEEHCLFCPILKMNPQVGSKESLDSSETCVRFSA